MKTLGFSTSGLFFKSTHPFSRIERLESRIAPAFTSVLVGTTATLTGDGASDILSFATENGLLKHNRFTAGDAGFASDLDFDSAAAGIQTLAAEPTSSVSIALGGGGDLVQLGVDERASLLRAKFSIANTGVGTGTVSINDVLGTDGFEYVVGGGIMPPTNANLVLSGDLLASLAINTGPGADRVTLSGTLANSITITTNAGNDFVLGSNSTTNPMTIFGEDGDDFLQGGSGADLIFGGPGMDTIVGSNGNDVLFGQEGPDTFTWGPGNGSDLIEGGLGIDLLDFDGSAGAEIFEFSANGSRLLMTRNVGNIVMDVNDVEAIDLSALGGTDAITVNDLTPTDVESLRLNVGAFSGGGDAATDTLILNGSELSEEVRVTRFSNTFHVFGLPAYIEFVGAEPIDQLTINGNGGVDNLFATEVVRASMIVTLNGETTFDDPIPTTFSAPASFDLPRNPTAVATGNLFGFGPDLVVVHPKSNAISILINAGDGTFLPAVTLNTGGKNPKSVALADLNGDGRLDIAVTNSASANVSIFLNTGTGSFSPPALVPTGKNPGVIRAGDMTGDGEIDLVMITAGNALTRLTGDGAGNFADPLKISTGGKTPVDFVLADFNNDSRVDIAVANAASNTVSTLIANPDFTFAAPSISRVGIKPTALATGDFNGDGRPDLAVSHAVSRFASVLMNASAGTAAFNPQIKLSYPGKKVPSAIAVGDVDGDERADIVLANLATGSVGVFLSAADGIFRRAIDFDLDNTPLRKTAALALADFNSDGRLDIVVSNPGTNDLTVLYQIRTTA